MEITHKPTTKFNDLVYGNVFSYNNAMFIKIDDCGTCNCINAVDLSDGTVRYFEQGTDVAKIDCELVIH